MICNARYEIECRKTELGIPGDAEIFREVYETGIGGFRVLDRNDLNKKTKLEFEFIGEAV
jgi:hypothetical protein